MIEHHIELGQIEGFIQNKLTSMPKDHVDRPYIDSLLKSVTSQLDSLVGTLKLPKTDEEYIGNLDRLSEISSDSPEGNDLLKRREQYLEEQRSQGLLPNTFGERIAFHRKRLGLSQPALAQLTNTHASVINKLEKNKRRPSAKMIEILRKKLLLPMGYGADLNQLLVDSSLGRRFRNI